MKKEDMYEAIIKFVSDIKRGPFRYFNDERSDGTSDYIVKQNYQNANMSIYECAVYQAYLDMNRTVHGAKERKEEIDRMRSGIAESLKKYFFAKSKMEREAFDKWHESTMTKASTCANLTIGQVQKILNMAFKYLYCCKDIRNSKQDHFTYCHMPLDGYTLTWYSSEVVKKYEGEVWSAIKDVKAYRIIENNVREKLGDTKVLLAEFKIWQSEKERAEKIGVKKAAEKVARFSECNTELSKQLENFVATLNEQLNK